MPSRGLTDRELQSLIAGRLDAEGLQGLAREVGVDVVGLTRLEIENRLRDLEQTHLVHQQLRASAQGLQSAKHKLHSGLYEAPIDEKLHAALQELPEGGSTRESLTVEAAPHILARLIHDAAVRALRNVPAEDRLANQVALTNRVLKAFQETSRDSGISSEDAVRSPAQLLLAVRNEDAGLGTGAVERPMLPLRHSDLLVNGPRDLRIGNEVRREFASADRVDLIVSFLKWSGFRVVQKELAAFLARRPGALRVLTTTYLGATDPEVIEELLKLGAQVRVSYEDQATRLHAKGWLFHRNSGFSTAFVGSSNLSTSAMIDGLEWNIRVSVVDNSTIIHKFVGVFDQYWSDEAFKPYDRVRFEHATMRRRDENRDALARVAQLTPHSHQEEVLAALAVERTHGHTRNLVVAATGTGKTVIAALDYARIKKTWGDPSLLFVAHRREILTQSMATFRVAVGDGHFGELMVGDDRPTIGKHVFASIQSLNQAQLAKLKPDTFDVVVVDEFHHAEGETYQALLNHLRPKILLGLTATPERADGKSILGWFDGRIAAELRLWDALDRGLVVPFQYFGIYDETDLSNVGFSGGRYDVNDLERIYTGDHARARAVLRAMLAKIHDTKNLKALGFCVSVKHAEFMAKFFTESGLPSLAVSGESSKQERQEALQKLRAGAAKVLFSRDLFNEGIDVPSVNTVLLLRPTESATVFLQQLGRGLRREEGKACLTALDFIGHAHKKFRFDVRFQALLGGTRVAVRDAIEEGFPFLPAGCEIQLDRESQEAVLANIRASLGSDNRRLVEELRALGDVSLPAFLAATELDLEGLYRDGRSLTNLKRVAGVQKGAELENEVTRAFSRMLHIDDDGRLETWRSWLQADSAPEADSDDPMQLMFFSVLGHVRDSLAEMQNAFDNLWANVDLKREVVELFDVLADQQRRPSFALPDLPFRVHATYSRDEVSAGLRATTKNKKRTSDKGEAKIIRLQGGVYNASHARVDALFVTLNKDPDHFSPTTLYNDYPISQSRFHWESQAKTRADSDTGRRYQGLEDQPWRILLFVRKDIAKGGTTSPYLCLGPVRYVSHESEKPMQIIWDLEHPMPATFFNETKVAAG